MKHTASFYLFFLSDDALMESGSHFTSIILLFGNGAMLV